MATTSTTYNLYSNPINQGALVGRYATIDMSNTGKFANIITAVPVRYRFEVTDTTDDATGTVTRTITLIEGSTLTLLNGHSDTNSYNTLYEYTVLNSSASYDVITYTVLDESVSLTAEDYIVSSEATTDPTEYKWVVYSVDRGKLELVTSSSVSSGNATPLTYNESENMMYSPTGYQCTVPLGYFDANWNFTSFNAIGFYDNMFWVDQGVELLIPDGRTDIYGLKVDKTRINNICFTIFDGTEEHASSITWDSGSFLVKKDGSIIPTNNYSTSTLLPTTSEAGYIYISEDNYIYSVIPTSDETSIEATAVSACRLTDVEMVDGKFSSINGVNVYQSANFKDLKDDITAVDEATVHLTGDEEITGTKTFADEVIFENAVMNDITINAGDVAGELTVTGVISLDQDDDDADTIDTYVNNSVGYDGSAGGFYFKRDAYIVDAGNYSATNNCLNVVGATNASEGGVILGRYLTTSSSGTKTISQINKIYGNKSGNIVFTANNLLPNTNNSTNVGSSSIKFNTMYATTFNGTATKALWADLAENYETDKEYKIGTLVQFGGEKEVTVATKEVNAVISENPAYLMNSGSQGQPIALAGRVKIRVVDNVRKFDKIYLSKEPGVGKVYNPVVALILRKKPIAVALEDKVEDGEDLVLCATHFSI